MIIDTHTHTHTHTYIYIYIYLLKSDNKNIYNASKNVNKVFVIQRTLKTGETAAEN